MNNTTRVTDFLDQFDIAYQYFQHPGPVYSLEQAASERQQSPSQVVRSILFRISQGDYVMVLVAGPSQISWPALRSYLGLSRLTMASREEVLEVTGYETGAVSPFGLPTRLRILIDNSVTAQSEISIGSGVRGSTVIMKTTDLLLALDGAELGTFAR
jgi:Cys-tRNA(Pro)/Cys-tRNA(Cys) deacylase